MGANEKHAATYHGGEYTPTANDIREVWGGFSEYGGLVIRPSGTATFLDDRYAEFDRWLETVRAEAKAEALNEAADKIDQIHSFGELPNGAIREEFRKEYWAFTEASKAGWLRIRANQHKEQS